MKGTSKITAGITVAQTQSILALELKLQENKNYTKETLKSANAQDLPLPSPPQSPQPPPTPPPLYNATQSPRYLRTIAGVHTELASATSPHQGRARSNPHPAGPCPTRAASPAAARGWAK